MENICSSLFVVSALMKRRTNGLSQTHFFIPRVNFDKLIQSAEVILVNDLHLMEIRYPEL